MISTHCTDKFNTHLALAYCLQIQKKDKLLRANLNGSGLLLDGKFAFQWDRKGQLWGLLSCPTIRMRSHHKAKIRQSTKVFCIKC